MSFADRENPKTLVLFDVDETLTPARLTISNEMRETLKKLRKKVVIGFVGGSDLSKQLEQLGHTVLDDFDYCFSENGLTAYKLGEELASQSFIGWIGQEKYNKLIKFVLRYLSEIDIPIRRGTFVEFRSGMINISPIGRNASNKERNEFDIYDLKHHIREDMVKALKENFADYGLTYSIGGKISFDVFPTGWDKTYCLKHVEKEGFEEIHFFGDKTLPGGNDYEIYTDERTIGHSVDGPEETQKLLEEIFKLKVVELFGQPLENPRFIGGIALKVLWFHQWGQARRLAIFGNLTISKLASFVVAERENIFSTSSIVQFNERMVAASRDVIHIDGRELVFFFVELAKVYQGFHHLWLVTNMKKPVGSKLAFKTIAKGHDHILVNIAILHVDIQYGAFIIGV